MSRSETEHPEVTAGTALETENSPTEGPVIVPRDHVGLWVAWSADGRRLLGAAETLEEAERLARQRDEPEAIFERPSAPHRP